MLQGSVGILQNRAVDPHSFVSDPDPAVFLHANPDPAVFFFFQCGSGSSCFCNADTIHLKQNFVKNYLIKIFPKLNKNYSKVKNM